MRAPLWGGLWTASLHRCSASQSPPPPTCEGDWRYLTAQLLVDAGQSEASVQTTMRHATASMTRRYAMQRDHGENATMLARVLLEARTA